jgi:hypothetical protein
MGHPTLATHPGFARRMLAACAAVVLALSVAGNVLAAGLTVTFTSLPVAYRDNPTHASIKTTAGARCTIRVKYSSGYSHAKGLGAKTAPASGKVTWTWEVGKSTRLGKWPVTVTCTKGSKSGTATRLMTVK